MASLVVDWDGTDLLAIFGSEEVAREAYDRQRAARHHA
jgi:hypothetical protein